MTEPVARKWSFTTIGSLVLPIVVIGLAACERREIGSKHEPSSVLARVNEHALTEREFTAFLPEDYRDALTSDELQEYLDRWIVTQLLYDEGMRSGLGGSSDIETRLEQYRKDMVADQLVQRVIQDRAVVTEEEVRTYYEGHAGEYATEYRVSHILVNTLEEAQKVKQEIGERSFAYLARKYSIDKHSGAGGDLGYLSKGNMIPEFEGVVFDMQLGEVSDIIESEFGYHIIMVVDIRQATEKLEFDDVKDEITNMLMMERREAVYDSLVTTLRQKADVEIMERAKTLGVPVPAEIDTLVEAE
jgi:peptidyl-prolyl cis-trans isomerase C